MAGVAGQNYPTDLTQGILWSARLLSANGCQRQRNPNHFLGLLDLPIPEVCGPYRPPLPSLPLEGLRSLAASCASTLFIWGAKLVSGSAAVPHVWLRGAKLSVPVRPAFIRPLVPSTTKAPPKEVKLGGYHFQVCKDSDRVRLYSRTAMHAPPFRAPYSIIGDGGAR
jgi:hypothetical protein